MAREVDAGSTAGRDVVVGSRSAELHMADPSGWAEDDGDHWPGKAGRSRLHEANRTSRQESTDYGGAIRNGNGGRTGEDDAGGILHHRLLGNCVQQEEALDLALARHVQPAVIQMEGEAQSCRDSFRLLSSRQCHSQPWKGGTRERIHSRDDRTVVDGDGSAQHPRNDDAVHCCTLGRIRRTIRAIGCDTTHSSLHCRTVARRVVGAPAEK